MRHRLSRAAVAFAVALAAGCGETPGVSPPGPAGGARAGSRNPDAREAAKVGETRAPSPNMYMEK
jgi:hypothetical protein